MREFVANRSATSNIRLTTYEAQLAEAEIDIPKKVQKKRLKFLEARFEAVCDEDD